jgi:hypothetical protein
MWKKLHRLAESQKGGSTISNLHLHLHLDLHLSSYRIHRLSFTVSAGLFDMQSDEMSPAARLPGTGIHCQSLAGPWCVARR